jgi:hypothetical protein
MWRQHILARVGVRPGRGLKNLLSESAGQDNAIQFDARHRPAANGAADSDRDRLLTGTTEQSLAPVRAEHDAVQTIRQRRWSRGRCLLILSDLLGRGTTVCRE